MTLFEVLLIICLTAIAAIILIGIIVFGLFKAKKYSKKGGLEARFLFDSSRIVWRLVNKGVRNITIVEIGINCGGYNSSYRPLFSTAEEVNSIPYIIGSGEIASFRKEIERFRFRPTEIASLKKSNPFITFYVKDAESTVYQTQSEVRFTEYMAKLG